MRWCRWVLPVAPAGVRRIRPMAHSAPTVNAEEALERLKEGNARFLRGEARFPTVQKEILADLALGQQPYATVLGCSDSRVPPELIFDAGFGELFVIRVAGNVLGPTILGTLQYAGFHLRTALFVVLGHEGCGAVQAALAWKFEGTEQKSRIQTLIADIVPALDHVDPRMPGREQLSLAVEANVRHTVRQLRATPEGKARAADRTMHLLGAVYEIETGRVRFLDGAD
jgi:carbonic anhydrase